MLPCLVLGLLGHHQIHGGEQVFPSASNEAVRSKSEAVGGLLRARGDHTDRLHDTGEAMHERAAPLRHADDVEDVTGRLDVTELARNWPIPRHRVISCCKILVHDHVEADGINGRKCLGDLAHVGDTVALLDSETNVSVVKVIVVILLSHEPLVDAEYATRLEDTEDLAVDSLKGGSVDRRLNRVNSVERVVREGHLLRSTRTSARVIRTCRAIGTYHEVTLDKLELVREALLLSIVGRAVNLVVVVVQAGDMTSSELGNLAGRTADTAANVKDPHALLDSDAVCEVMLVAGNGLEKGLADAEAAEVERLAPSVFVKVGREVVIARPATSVLDIGE